MTTELMKIATRYSLVATLAMGIGCANTDSTAPSGASELGITKFETKDTATKTSVIGLDGGGREVARLDLIHGRFELTGVFKDDYPGQPEVDGRKLDVTIHGDPRLNWETAGYDPTLHMPAHPPDETELIAFLEDPHVKSVLDRWQIGFDPTDTLDFELERGYSTFGYTTGSSWYNCKTNNPSTACGTARGFTINTCGGGYTPDSAYRVTRTSPYAEYFIDQCCPAGSGSQSNDWFGRKSCPTSGSGSQPSTCGTASAACKGCAGYPKNATLGCSVQPGTQTKWCYGGNLNGGDCTVDSECCQFTKSWCDVQYGSGLCEYCIASDDDCTSGNQCCSGSCVSGLCS